MRNGEKGAIFSFFFVLEGRKERKKNSTHKVMAPLSVGEGRVMARAVLREEGFPEGLVGWLRKCGDQLQDFQVLWVFFGRSISVSILYPQRGTGVPCVKRKKKSPLLVPRPLFLHECTHPASLKWLGDSLQLTDAEAGT